MGRYRFKDNNRIISVVDSETDETVARYEVDYHWQEKNVSVCEDYINVRLYNRIKGYLDCRVVIGNTDNVQHIPEK